MTVLSILAVLCLLVACVLLATLAFIDLKIGLLPDIYVFPLAALGWVFHFASGFQYFSPTDLILGMVVGGGILLVIRFLADKFYQPDSLGLGDVKLMGAAGAWLGPYYILLALTFGALAGIVHGLGLGFYKMSKDKTPLNLNTLSLPAGPGLIVGILITTIFACTEKF